MRSSWLGTFTLPHVSALNITTTVIESAVMDDKEHTIAAPKGAKSKAWKYFGFQISEGKTVDEKKVMCTLCDVKITYRGNTTNLQQHLRIHHFKEYEALMGGSTSRQMTLEEATDASRTIHKTSAKRCQEINRAVATFIARDMRPIAAIEGEGFKQLIHVLEPGYTLPS